MGASEMGRKQYTHSFILKESYRRVVEDLLAKKLPVDIQVTVESVKRSETLAYRRFERMLRKQYLLTEIEAKRFRQLFRRLKSGERARKTPA